MRQKFVLIPSKQHDLDSMWLIVAALLILKAVDIVL